MSGAAPLSAALQSTLEKRLGGKTKALQGYGELLKGFLSLFLPHSSKADLSIHFLSFSLTS